MEGRLLVSTGEGPLAGLLSRSRASERGAAVVEFALVAPLLLLLVFGMISYGYMLSFRQALSQGAAEGARAAAVTVASTDGSEQTDAARAALDEALGSYGISCSGTTLLKGSAAVGSCGVAIAPCVGDADQDCATVSVDYAYEEHPLIPSVPGLGIVLPGHLSYSSVARVS